MVIYPTSNQGDVGLNPIRGNMYIHTNQVPKLSMVFICIQVFCVIVVSSYLMFSNCVGSVDVLIKALFTRHKLT